MSKTLIGKKLTLYRIKKRKTKSQITLNYSLKLMELK